MRIAAALALAALVAAPAAARADIICAPSDSPTGFYACASVNLSWNAGSIYMDVANMGAWQDVAMTMPVGGYGYQLLGIGFDGSNFSSANVTGLTVMNMGAGTSGTCGASVAACWSLVTSLSGDLPVEVGASVSGGPHGAIRGCVDAGGGTAHYTTCGGGFVRFAFATSGYSEADFNAASFQYSMRGISGPSDASFKCGPTATLEGQSRACVPTTTVPEPMSLVLLGTGLVGIAGVAHRRRKNGDVTDA